jgi:hypothetical protein
MAKRKRAATRFVVKTVTAALITNLKTVPCKLSIKCPGLLSKPPFPFLVLTEERRGGRQLKAFVRELSRLIDTPRETKRQAGRKSRRG